LGFENFGYKKKYILSLWCWEENAAFALWGSVKSSSFGSESFECEKFLLLLWESFSCGAVELSAFGFLDFEFEKVSPWLRGCGFMGFVGLSVLVGCGDVFGFPGHVGLTVMVSGSGCQVCVWQWSSLFGLDRFDFDNDVVDDRYDLCAVEDASICEPKEV
jgi:hypothetical protein